MGEKKLKLIWKASGYMDAQLLKGYMESYGIDVYDFEESVGKSYGLTATSLGEVEIYVSEDQLKEAEKHLHEYLEAINKEDGN